MKLLHAHSQHIWVTARAARDRAMETVDPLKHPPSDAIVAIILSAAATEAFINELAEYCVRVHDVLTAQQQSFVDVIDEMERARPREALQQKYLRAAAALGRPFDPGLPPFQDFKILVKLRDSLMHVKPKANTVDSDGRPMPKHVRILQQRGLARNDVSWFDALLTPKIAAWAPATARAVMLAVLDQFPASPARSFWGLLRNLN